MTEPRVVGVDHGRVWHYAANTNGIVGRTLCGLVVSRTNHPRVKSICLKCSKAWRESDGVPRHLAMCLRCFTTKNKRIGSAECDRCLASCPICGGTGPDRVDEDPEGGIEMACGDDWHDCKESSDV